jgi:hypothetical protein
MPLCASRVGDHPKESPMRTDTILAWTMNFVAGCGPRGFTRQFVDNSGDHPEVHPLFLASCQEIVGAWACLYHAGVTKPEVLRSTFLHYSLDLLFMRALAVGEVVNTTVTLAGVGQRRSGGHFVSHMAHCDVGGNLVGESWWGGILLGYQGVEGKRYILEPPPRIEPTAWTRSDECVTVKVDPAAAHIWDACIRNPRQSKAASSDINTHTNIAFARKAGLPERTLNGLCVLALALPWVIDAVTKDQANVARVIRVACLFSAPVFLAFEPISLEVRVLNTSICHAVRGNHGTGEVVVAIFEVVNPEGKAAIRQGYVEIDLGKKSPKL